MPNLCNEIKSLSSIFGLNCSLKSSLSELKRNGKIFLKSNAAKINNKNYSRESHSKTNTNNNIFGPKKKT